MNAIRLVHARGLALAASLLAIAATSPAQVPLADQPVFSSVNVPGNLALALSVEFPTAVSVAHPNRTYASTNNYLGYFDPGKCYKYKYVSDSGADSNNNYFYPTGKAKDRVCSGEWSGNFLNWASMQTIDPFRWALTGGYRWIDTPELTVLEKAWNTNQGADSNFPNSETTDSAVIAGATPFTNATKLGTAILRYGNKMRFMAVAKNSPDYSGTPVHFQGTAKLSVQYEVFVRVKVCDKDVGVESNCVAYSKGNYYKPEGLMQKYASKIRYSAFGYLASDNSGDANLKRDGAVLRASQRFIGPTQPVPGSPDIINKDAPEWSTETGVMTINPSPTDANDSSKDGVTIENSGVMNYLNKFGEINRKVYKRYDAVSELYYAALRYFRNLGNVSEWSSMDGASKDERETMLDGFPITTTWKDPVQYSCQRNFILGIGDVNTHADRNLPGATTGKKEPAMPTTVFNDKVNAVEWTNKVGALQGLGNDLGTKLTANNDAGYLMAGLAYYANTTDIRDDLTGKQTVKTYWLDVLENGYQKDKQFYLAAKYGGFVPPDDYKVESATAKDFENNKGWWTTSGQTIGGQDKPDTFHTAARADLMVDGLTAAFSSISSQLSAYSSSFVTAEPQISSLGTASYGTTYDARSWTGDVEANTAKFNAKTGQPELDKRWSFAAVLATQAAGEGWQKRNIVTYNTSSKVGVPLRSGKISDDQKNHLDTSYVSGDDKENYLNYLRGERKHEVSSKADGSAKAYRDRTSLVGDVVNAKARPVGTPSAQYSSVTNPGYDKFKADYARRIPMVYVGTNAGMVHAINGSLTGADAGKEVFAYVPGVSFAGPTSTPNINGLAHLGNPDFKHRFMVDAPPLAADVDLGRTGGATAGAVNWRTLLLGGLGKGGKAIYALDITDPKAITDKAEGDPQEAEAATKVMWEFTDPDLGYTYGQPVVVKTRKHGWVVVVGSGYNNGNGKGYFFFINPSTGARLEKIEAPCDNTTCTPSNQAGLAHLNGFMLDSTDGTADTIYGGDLMGNVWRLDVSGTGDYPTPVKFATLTGSDGKVLPITSKPLPVVQPGTNRRYITVGTGRLLDPSDLNSGQAQRFFAILDGTNAAFSNDGTVAGKASDIPKGVTFPLTVATMRQVSDLSQKITLDLRKEVGWYLDLGASAGGPGWRVLSDPVSFYGMVAFAATAPSSGNACSPNGSSRLYAVDLGTGSCALEPSSSTCYFTPDGVITDVQFVQRTGGSGGTEGSEDPGCPPGQICTEVACGTDKGKACAKPAPPDKGVGLQRLNWREILISN
jgi:type IV pilus assembly protein PilY1